MYYIRLLFTFNALYYIIIYLSIYLSVYLSIYQVPENWKTKEKSRSTSKQLWQRQKRPLIGVEVPGWDDGIFRVSP